MMSLAAGSLGTQSMDNMGFPPYSAVETGTPPAGNFTVRFDGSGTHYFRVKNYMGNYIELKLYAGPHAGSLALQASASGSGSVVTLTHQLTLDRHYYLTVNGAGFKKTTLKISNDNYP